MGDTEIKEKLEQFLNVGKDWEKKATNIPGIFILKLPRYQGSSSLALEINPIDSSGVPARKRGIIIRTSSEMELIARLLSNEKINALSKNIDGINSENKNLSTNENSGVINI